MKQMIGSAICPAKEAVNGILLSEEKMPYQGTVNIYFMQKTVALMETEFGIIKIFAKSMRSDMRMVQSKGLLVNYEMMPMHGIIAWDISRFLRPRLSK